MKLLYLANLRLPTEKAYGIQITKTCEALSKLTEVELIAPYRRNTQESSFLITRIPAPDFYLSGRLDVLAVAVKDFISGFLLALYAFRKNGIIYSRDEWPLVFLAPFRKVVFEAHKFSKWRKPFYFWFWLWRVKLVCISSALRREFISFYHSLTPHGQKLNPILVAHSGVDIDKTRSGWKSTKPRVTYTGSLGKEKGVEVVAQATKDLDVETWVVGGSIEEVLTLKKNYPHLRTTTHITQEGVREYLVSADILVLPTLSDDTGSPLKMFEYMAARRPIIASRLAGVTEVLNETNSVLVPPGDPVALKEAIQKVLANKQFADRIANQAHLDVHAYTWENRAKKILKFIE